MFKLTVCQGEIIHEKGSNLTVALCLGNTENCLFGFLEEPFQNVAILLADKNHLHFKTSQTAKNKSYPLHFYLS